MGCSEEKLHKLKGLSLIFWNPLDQIHSGSLDWSQNWFKLVWKINNNPIRISCKLPICEQVRFEDFMLWPICEQVRFEDFIVAMKIVHGKSMKWWILNQLHFPLLYTLIYSSYRWLIVSALTAYTSFGRYPAITWTIVDLPSKVFCVFHCRAISEEVLRNCQNWIRNLCSELTLWSLLQGAMS